MLSDEGYAGLGLEFTLPAMIAAGVLASTPLEWLERLPEHPLRVFVPFVFPWVLAGVFSLFFLTGAGVKLAIAESDPLVLLLVPLAAPLAVYTSAFRLSVIDPRRAADELLARRGAPPNAAPRRLTPTLP